MSLMDIYLHKPSGVRYALVRLLGDVWELHPVIGPEKRVSVAILRDAEIWQKC